LSRQGTRCRRSVVSSHSHSANIKLRPAEARFSVTRIAYRKARTAALRQLFQGCQGLELAVFRLCSRTYTIPFVASSERRQTQRLRRPRGPVRTLWTRILQSRGVLSTVIQRLYRSRSCEAACGFCTLLYALATDVGFRACPPRRVLRANGDVPLVSGLIVRQRA
jgi:hypothetical protein